MGCTDSKLKHHRELLEQLEATIQRPWHVRSVPAALDHLSEFVASLAEVNEYFRNIRHNAAVVARVVILAKQISQELLKLMDARLIRSKDTVTLQKAKSLAKHLDVVDDASDSFKKLESKIKGLHKQLAHEQLNKADAFLQRASDPLSMAEHAPHVLAVLKEARTHIEEAPELRNLMLQHCTAFIERLLYCLRVTGESDTTLFRRFAGLARSLDDLCPARTMWPKFTEQVEHVRRELAAEVAPRLVVSMANALERGPSDMDLAKIIQTLGQLEPMWVMQPPEVVGRLIGVFSMLEAHINSAFDRALFAGEGSRLESLVAFAKEVEQRRSTFLGAGADDDAYKFSKHLERQKAGVTLKTLLENAEGSVAARSEELHVAFEEAEAKVKAIQPRERLKQKAESCRWTFKLTNGMFKAFPADKISEVESLYQKWVTSSKTDQNKVDLRRVEISILIEGGARRPSGSRPGSEHAGSGSASASSSSAFVGAGSPRSIAAEVSTRRPKCPYGANCYRKNPSHKDECCHPGEQDWDDLLASPRLPPPPPPAMSTRSIGSDGDTGSEVWTPDAMTGTRSSVVHERFSVDFMLMTQVNLSARRGIRAIKRSEGLTFAQQHTEDYFGRVVDFVREAEDIFAAAELELRLLGDAEREGMQTQVDHLLQAMRPALSEFLGLAVFIEDMKVIDDVLALLGVHTEGLGLKDVLKRLRLQDVLDELRLAYQQESVVAMPPWDLLRQMCKDQPIGGRLYRYRVERIKTKLEIQTLTRRHVQIRCQALLSEYDDDGAFKASFRNGTVQIFLELQQQAVDRGPAEVFQSTMRLAATWQCDVEPLVRPTRLFISQLVAGAVRSKLQPFARISEALDVGNDVAKAAQRQLTDVCELGVLLVEIATRALLELDELLNTPDDSERMSSSVKQLVELRSKFTSDELSKELDREFWALFKAHYEAVFVTSTDMQTRAVEWAIAVCEQLGQTLPPWMMTKDQVEAIRKLQSAIGSGVESELREAAIFAKQADYKSDQQLAQMYESAMEQLRKLKRLPAGWEVHDLVGDDAKAKMFKKVDITGDSLTLQFQRLFDKTNLGLVTRDRDGAMPRGYKVQKVESVWNVDSWSSYIGRLDAMTEQCKKFPGDAPVADWSRWSGPLLTDKLGSDILAAARLPSLAAGANEFLMLHGTNPESAHEIAMNSFDMAFACKTGLFGAGIYFAESSSKSDEYVKPNKEGHFPVIMCRVALGRINYCDSKDPTKDPGRDKLESSCLRGDFHSVLGDRKKARGTYREFVVYDHYQVYPHFIVWYSRISG